jgi:hypothetical protein
MLVPCLPIMVCTNRLSDRCSHFVVLHPGGAVPPNNYLRCLFIFISPLHVSGLSLWSSGQTSWLQIQEPGYDSRHYQIFWEVVGLERGSLSLVSTIEELLERKSSGSGLESREYGRRDPSLWPRGTLYPQKLALTSLIIVGRSVGIVHLRTKATELSLILV